MLKEVERRRKEAKKQQQRWQMRYTETRGSTIQLDRTDSIAKRERRASMRGIIHTERSQTPGSATQALSQRVHPIIIEDVKMIKTEPKEIISDQMKPDAGEDTIRLEESEYHGSISPSDIIWTHDSTIKPLRTEPDKVDDDDDDGDDDDDDDGEGDDGDDTAIQPDVRESAVEPEITKGLESAIQPEMIGDEEIIQPEIIGEPEGEIQPEMIEDPQSIITPESSQYVEGVTVEQTSLKDDSEDEQESRV